MFAEIVAASELPKGVLNIVYGKGGTTGAALTSNPDVGLITFTGSTRAGQAIMAAAAHNITKVNLELGGKAPAIVMDDADLDLAARAILQSRITNNGQVCNCAERIYVHAAVADDFISRFGALLQAVTYGDPLSGQPIDMGPLINQAAITKVESMVQRAVGQGAKLVFGGHSDRRNNGYFFQPTLLTNCGADMEIMREEIFGPVAPVQVVRDLDEAITLANDSPYGLTSSIYTRDLKTALRACNEIDFGETYINRENFEAIQGFHAGVRKSGIGGADGKHGLYEFMATHVVYLNA